MTPMNSLGMRNPNSSPSGNSNLLSSISSQGMPQGNSLEESQEPNELNPSQQFLQQFSQAVNPLKDVLDNTNYAFAKKEADLLRRALENYMEAVVTGISVQNNQAGLGGELMRNPSY